MRIRHYFNQLTQNSSYDLQSDTLSQGDKKSSTLPKQTREKTSQTSPKKPLRSITKKADQGSDQDLGSRIKQAGKRALTSSQSLRISSSVPTLGQAKGFAETDPKVGSIDALMVKFKTIFCHHWFLISTDICCQHIWWGRNGGNNFGDDILDLFGDHKHVKPPWLQLKQSTPVVHEDKLPDWLWLGWHRTNRRSNKLQVKRLPTS